MPSAPTRINTSAWFTRSVLTTGPIVVSEPCDSMGPRAASRAVTISPSLPSVGRSAMPAPADGEGEADAPGLAAAGDPLGEALGVGVGDGVGLGDGVGDGDGLALAPGEPDGDWDAAGDAEGDPKGDAAAEADADAPGLAVDVGSGVGEGAGGRRPIGAVLISRKPSLVATTDAGRPFWAKTAAT